MWDQTPIFAVFKGELLSVKGKLLLDSTKPAFAVELKREWLALFGT